MIIREIAERAAGYAEGLEIVDYCICLRGGYVVVEGPAGRALGFAHIPHEDLHDLGEVKRPRLEDMAGFVVDLNPLNRVLGVAMVNAVSQYHMGELPAEWDVLKYVGEGPVCVVGNMRPLVERVKNLGVEVWVFEKSRELRAFAFSEVEEELLLPRCKTAIITGAALLNFSIDRVLELSRGVNILVGPTAGVHPEFLPPRVKGKKLHVLASIKLDVEKTVAHLRLGGYISLAVHRHLGRPYTYDLTTGR